MGKALYEQTILHDTDLQVLSMHDDDLSAENNKYFPTEKFKGYGAAKSNFVLAAIKESFKKDVVILSHINLLVVGWMIKKRNPSIKIYLIAHGIELWQPLSKLKQLLLKVCTKIIAVSNFTAQKVVSSQHIKINKTAVLNNCLDPFLQKPLLKEGCHATAKKYGISYNDKVIVTLTRLSSKERYKGYDIVLKALHVYKTKNSHFKYILAGKYDENEKFYIQNIIQQFQLQQQVILTGYLNDSDIAPLFALADLYIMPSSKEGFGIVFIEAMFYGVPVIAGNKDGSVDALLHGELGILVNPESVQEIENAIEKILQNPIAYKPNQLLLNNNFSYNTYKEKLYNILVQ